MIAAVVDRHYKTHYVADKRNRFKDSIGHPDKSAVKFDQEELRQALDRYLRPVIDAKRGVGAIFVNVMEKLTMADPKATLRTRLEAAMDAGVDGITLSAGLHLSFTRFNC